MGKRTEVQPPQRELMYASEADRLPIAQGMFVLVGEPFERVVGEIEHEDGEKFALTQDRVRFTVVAYDQTVGDGEAVTFSFTSNRWNAEQLPQVTAEQLDALRNLSGHNLFLYIRRLYQKSSSQLLFPLTGNEEYKRIWKLSILANSKGRARVDKEAVSRNRQELNRMTEEIIERSERARARRDNQVDDGVEF